jgi:hypothetical protein
MMGKTEANLRLLQRQCELALSYLRRRRLLLGGLHIVTRC